MKYPDAHQYIFVMAQLSHVASNLLERKSQRLSHIPTLISFMQEKTILAKILKMMCARRAGNKAISKASCTTLLSPKIARHSNDINKGRVAVAGQRRRRANKKKNRDARARVAKSARLRRLGAAVHQRARLEIHKPRWWFRVIAVSGSLRLLSLGEIGFVFMRLQQRAGSPGPLN